MTKHQGYAIDALHEANGGGYQVCYKASGGNGTFTGDVDNPVWISLGKRHETEDAAKAYIDGLNGLK